MPRGLGGNEAPDGFSDALVLQRASCDTCRNITRRIEEECLISMMGPGRAKLGLRRKDRASPTTTADIDLPDGTREERELHWSEVPGPIVLPSFYEAGVLSDKPTPDVAPCDYKIVVVAPGRGPIFDEASRVGVSLSANAKTFAQLLAKIGLGISVAHLGFGGFTPLIQDFVRTNPDEYGRWVGGFAGTSRIEPRSRELHSVRLIPNGGPDGKFIVVELRLFAEFGGPTNYVVVGRQL